MANLKELLGDKYKEGMTVDEAEQALANIKLADISAGAYVSKDKYLDMDKQYKELQKKHMTAEELQKQQEETTQKSIREMQDKIAGYEFKDSLVKLGYNSSEVEKIIKSGNSPTAFTEVMASRIELAKQEAVAKALKDGSPNYNQGDPNATVSTKDAFMKLSTAEQMKYKAENPDWQQKLK